MLENRNIIVFADDWGRHPSTMQHIGKVLSEKNRLLWVGSLGLRRPELGLKDFKRLYEKFRKIISPSKNETDKEETPNVIEIHPFVLPFHDNKIIHVINNFLLLRILKSKMKKLNFLEPVIITSSPIMYALFGKLGERSSHYICLDDYSLFNGAFHSLIQFEKYTLDKVNSSFSVSKPLLLSRLPKSGINNFLPQGVDLNHFTPKRKNSIQRFKGMKSPIIGFFGLISEWVDLEIIIHLAKTLPDYSIVLIGDTVIDTSVLKQFPNINFTGKVSYELLPEYASEFSVGIIPFKINDLTKAVNPLKLIEYLALGLPVVTTPMDEVIQFKDYICIAKEKEEFVQMVKNEILSDSDSKREQRRKMASNYSWDSITHELGKIILSTEKGTTN